jgi:Mitochondrial 18 KDa protein (MTP18)
MQNDSNKIKNTENNVNNDTNGNTVTSNNPSDENFNIFRHSSLRYAGYANEIGEAFRYQYPKLVKPSYAIAMTYVVADACYSGYQNVKPSTMFHQDKDQSKQQHQGQLVPNLKYSGSRTAEEQEQKAETCTDGLNCGAIRCKNEKQDQSNREKICIDKVNLARTRSVSFIDALLWQSLASVVLPGLTIYSIVRLSDIMTKTAVLAAKQNSALFQNNFWLSSAQKWLPTTVGLLSIPMIIHPIDTLVDTIMDQTFRQWF